MKRCVEAVRPRVEKFTEDEEEQDKGVASYAAPLVHFCPQCGQFTGDGGGVKSREETTN